MPLKGVHKSIENNIEHSAWLADGFEFCTKSQAFPHLSITTSTLKVSEMIRKARVYDWIGG